jgi:hypothetical protein
MHEATIHDPTNKFEPKHLRIEGKSAHEKQVKIARKRHENPTSYKWRINATMKASIHSEVRFFTNEGKM